jgi:hypothetical protein
MATTRRRHMEKQLNFFTTDTEEDEYPALWPHLPKECRQALERMFAQILVKHLSVCLEKEEEEDDESDES